MVSNIEAENDLVELTFVNIEASIAKRRWQSSNESDEFASGHVRLTERIELHPCIEERLDVALLQR